MRFACFGGEYKKVTRFLLLCFICLMGLWFSTAGCCCCCCWQCRKTEWRRDCPRNRPRGVRDCGCGSRPEEHPFWKKQREPYVLGKQSPLVLVWWLFLAACRDCLRCRRRDRLPEWPTHVVAGDQQQPPRMPFLGKRHSTSCPRGPRRAILVAGKHRRAGIVVVGGGGGESP